MYVLDVIGKFSRFVDMRSLIRGGTLSAANKRMNNCYCSECNLSLYYVLVNENKAIKKIK